MASRKAEVTSNDPTKLSIENGRSKIRGSTVWKNTVVLTSITEKNLKPTKIVNAINSKNTVCANLL